MAYTIEGGIWSSVFAVPTTVVDDHIRMCSPFALKVLLFMLRQPGIPMDTIWLAEQLHSSPRDIQDAISYWIGAGIIKDQNNSSPGVGEMLSKPSLPIVPEHSTVSTPAAPEPFVSEKIVEGQRIVTTSARPKIGRSDITEISRTDPSLAQLLQEAQSVIGGPLNNIDSEILAALYTYYALPMDVILMLLQYCVSAGKMNMHTVEKMAASWVEKNITTHERVEQELLRLTESGENEIKIVRAFRIQGRGLTAKEKEYVERWFALGMDERVIAYACESTLDRIGKVSFGYADKIVTAWKSKGINTVKDAILDQQQNTSKFSPQQNKAAQTAGSSIDKDALDAYISGQFAD